jgi:hypothetical protein
MNHETPSPARHARTSALRSPGLAWRAFIVLTALLLTLFTVYDQVFRRVSLKYIWDEQLRFHRWIIEGTSIDPWQYRVLAPYLIEAVRWAFEALAIPFSYGRAFFGLRLMQNMLIFLLWPAYFSRHRVRRNLTLLGMLILLPAALLMAQREERPEEDRGGGDLRHLCAKTPNEQGA